MSLGAARVIYQINDLSMYVDQLMQGYVCIVAVTERGPLWTPTPVASIDDYERIFGLTFESSADPLVIQSGLLQGAKFFVIRIVHCDNPANPVTMTAVCSSLTLMDNGATPTSARVQSETGPFVIIAPTPGVVTCTQAAPYTFSAGACALSITVGTGSPQTVTLSGTTQSQFQVAAQINAAITGVTASAYGPFVQIKATNATESLTLNAITADAYSVLGLIEGLYSNIVGNNTLVLSIDGGTNQTFTLTGGSTQSATQVAEDLATMTGATATSTQGVLVITSNSQGFLSSVQIQPSSTCLAATGLPTTIATGTLGVSENTLKFTAKNPGVWGDQLCIATYRNALNPTTAFDVSITYYNQSGMNEYWSNLDMTPGSKQYAPVYINQMSQWVTCADMNSPNPNPANFPIINNTGWFLGGGDDGIVGLCDSDYIGDSLAQTGLYASQLCDESIDLMIPGSQSIPVLQNLIAYCETTGNFVSYGNPPPGCDPTNVINWRMGNPPYSHEAFNSHMFSIFAFRPLYYDSRTNSTSYISNLGMLASCISNTDTNYNYSYAPVGPRRGKVNLVEGVDFNMANYRGFADQFADNEINYLMITHQPGIEGAVFWEQYTTQCNTSALQDLNVVRFLTMLKRILVPVLNMYLFEPNDPVTWRQVDRVLQPVFQTFKDNGSIYDFELQTDDLAYWDGGVLKNAVMNTGSSIDQGIYKCRVLIQPTRAIRYLMFTVGVLPTGEAFTDFQEMSTLPGVVSN
jgi:hypothetical protein